ncbi:MAG: TIGR00725 family protein [Nitrososphaeraceae archaeon]
MRFNKYKIPTNLLSCMRKFQIAVIGYNKDGCTEHARNIAFEVGKEIAISGSILICGGLGGVMEAACRGAKTNGGMTLGIIPQEAFSFANEFCDIVICTGIGFARDFIVATSADGIIAVGGGVGTLIELGVGYITRKRMVVVSGSGGVSEIYGGKFLDERNTVPLIIAKDAHSAVEIILNRKQDENQNS